MNAFLALAPWGKDPISLEAQVHSVCLEQKPLAVTGYLIRTGPGLRDARKRLCLQG